MYDRLVATDGEVEVRPTLWLYSFKMRLRTWKAVNAKVQD
jgi:hypothetical protein